MNQRISYSRSMALLLAVSLAGLSYGAAQMQGNPHKRAMPVAQELAAIPDLDHRLANLEQELKAASDQKSISATTARYILEVTKEAKKTPTAFDGNAPGGPPPPGGPGGPDGHGGGPGGGPGGPGGLGKISDKYADYIAGSGITMNFAAELKRAEGLAADIKAGSDPLAGIKGDVHLAYRSDLDGMLLPYRIYVPSTYDKTRKYPLIVFLHGAMVDENTMMNDGVLQRAAEDRGYIVVAANGRGPMSGYSKGSGAVKDVLDVSALMQKYYNIDADRIFLTGHSMGGGGTWSIGMANRDRFAAIAVMAGTRSGTEDGDLDAELAAGPKIPILITCGGKDTNMPCPPALDAYAKVKAAGYTTKMVEYPDANHPAVFTSSIPEVFAWFDSYRK